MSGAEMLCVYQDLEHGLKELATGVEQVVDRILSGELGFEMTKNADK